MVFLHQVSSKKRTASSSSFVSPFPVPKIPKSDHHQSTSSTPSDSRSDDNAIDKMASILADAGCTLINRFGPPCLPSDHHKLRAHLNRRFSSSGSSRSDFLDGFSSYIDSRQNLRRVLISSGASGESLVRNLLLVPAIQQELQKMLLEKLPAYFDEDPDLCETSISLEDDIARLIINQFRWLDFLVDPKGFTEKLMEVLSISPLRLKKEIIGSLPEIIGDQNNALMVDSLEQLLREDSSIVVPVLDAFSNLTLEDMLQEQVITTALSCIRTIEGGEMPYLLRFLLLSATPANVRRIIHQIREQLKFLGLSRSLASQQSKHKGKLVVDDTESSILDALRSSLLFKNMLCQEILKALYSLQKPEDFKVIDIWLLVLIYNSGESMQKSVEKIFKKKIVDSCILECTVNQCICQNKGLVKDYFSSFISLSEYLLSSKELKARDFGKHTYICLFEELDDNYCRQEVLGALVTHVGSGVNFEVNSALEVLTVLASKYTRELIPLSSFLNGILDYLEGFSTENLHKVYEVFSQLALSAPVGADCTGKSIAHELFMIVRKQVSHPNTKYKKMGLIGILKIISCLEEANTVASLTTSCEKSDSEEVLELLRLSLDSCKSMPLLSVLFYDELTATLGSKKLHPGIIEWIGQQLGEFECMFLADLDGGQLPKKEMYSGLEGELWMNLDGEESPVCLNFLSLVSSSAESTSSLQILSANFHLLSTFERLTNQGSLAGIDALLGCPLHLPCFKYFSAVGWQSLTVKQKQISCLSLYFAANWIRELLNAFSTQVAGPDECTSQVVKEDIVGKLSKRLRNLICLESLLSVSMKQHNLSLPQLHFHSENCGVVDQIKNTTRLGKRDRQSEVQCSASPSNTNYPRTSKDSTSSDTNGKLRQQTIFDVFKKAGPMTTQDATNPESSTPCSTGEESSVQPVVAEFSSVDMALEVHRYKFRPLLVQCFSLLTFSKIQQSCCSDPAAELPMHLYLLHDLHNKLDFFIPSLGKPFSPRISNAPSSISRMSLREFISSIRPLFPFLKKHFDTAVSCLKEGDATCKEHWDIHSASAGNPDMTNVILSKYVVSTSVTKEVLKCFSKIINLPDILVDKSTLSDLLQAFHSSNMSSDVISGIQPIPSPGTIEYLYLGAFSFVDDVMDIACSFSFMLASESLFTLESITASLKAFIDRSERNGERNQSTSMNRVLNVLYQRASTSACKLLRQEWDSGKLENGWKDKGEMVQRMLRIYLDNNESKCDLLDELACSTLLQFSSSREDDDHGFPSLCNATFLVWYRVLVLMSTFHLLNSSSFCAWSAFVFFTHMELSYLQHEVNIMVLKQKVPRAPKAGGPPVQPEIIDRQVTDLQKSVKVVVSLVNMCRLHDKVNVRAMAVKYGGKFVDSFLKAFDFLEAHFQSHSETIIQLVMTLDHTTTLNALPSRFDIIEYVSDRNEQLKELQKATRTIQTVCSEAKGMKQTVVTCKIPGTKRSMERLLFRVKGLLQTSTATGCTLWIGNLKHKDLSGQVVSSQAYPAEPEEEPSNNEADDDMEGGGNHLYNEDESADSEKEPEEPEADETE
ncbi:Fanconi anemia group D2 protein homolog [Linum grandiflorum]